MRRSCRAAGATLAAPPWTHDDPGVKRRGRLIGVMVAIGALAACSADAPPIGHDGALIPGAVRVRMVPVHQTLDREWFQGPFLGGPPVRVAFSVTNTTDQMVRLGRCAAVGVDRHGIPLFPLVDTQIGHGWLEPGGSWGNLGDGSSTRQAEKGTTLEDLRSVVRYDVRCDAYRWIGPTPTPIVALEEEGD
jgi:hypothetical protein